LTRFDIFLSRKGNETEQSSCHYDLYDGVYETYHIVLRIIMMEEKQQHEKILLFFSFQIPQ